MSYNDSLGLFDEYDYFYENDTTLDGDITDLEAQNKPLHLIIKLSFEKYINKEQGIHK